MGLGQVITVNKGDLFLLLTMCEQARALGILCKEPVSVCLLYGFRAINVLFYFF